MSSEWQMLSIGEISTLVTKGTTPTSLGYQFSNQGVNYIKSESITFDGRIDKSKFAFIDVETHNALRRSQLESGDILFSMAGIYIGKTAVVKSDIIPANTNQAEGIIRIDRQRAQPEFIDFCLRNPVLRAYANSLVAQSAQPNLNLAEIKGLPINLPSLLEQKAIAHILGTLDDKIELNRKTNETLEAMAKALFKSWFVDFDPVRAKTEGCPTGLPDEISDLFPDSFEDSELGDIPSGWECCSFTQLVEVISGGTPKTSIDEYWNGSVNWFSVVDAPSRSDCWVIQTEKSITQQGLNNCSSKLLPTGTTIISARGTVGKVCLTGQDMAMNQSCYGLRSKAENGEYFCFYLTKSLVEILEARAHGSVFSTITRDTLDGVSTSSPPLEVIQSFNGIAGALLGKIKNNLEDNRILGNQRDALLPKLISGEIRIPDAVRMLEEIDI